MKRLRLLLPAALAGVGVFLLVGCIYVPMFNKVEEGQNYSKKVGNAKSRKPIRVGRAHRDDVMRVLGAPPYASPDGRRAAYPWSVTNGIWVWPLCFNAYAQRGNRALLLDFDEKGIVRGFRVEKYDGNVLYNEPGPAVPDGMQAWGLQRWPDEPDRTVPPR